MLYHFSQQDGKKAFEAGDARKEEAIVNFMRNPKEPPPPPPPEKPWSDEPSEVVHLTEDSFGNSLSMTRNVQANNLNVIVILLIAYFLFQIPF